MIVEGAPTELGREEIESVIDAERSGMVGFGGGLKGENRNIKRYMYNIKFCLKLIVEGAMTELVGRRLSRLLMPNTLVCQDLVAA